MTANQVKAIIEQGTDIPYQVGTASGATSIEFRKAVLSLEVKPQITPDGRILMQLDIKKDSVSLYRPAAPGGPWMSSTSRPRSWSRTAVRW
jgi:type IV pilus assembly protein PilQ